jgi:hypothetical protein
MSVWKVGLVSGVRFQCSGVRAMEIYQKLLVVFCHMFSDTRHLTPETYLLLKPKTVRFTRNDKYTYRGEKNRAK